MTEGSFSAANTYYNTICDQLITESLRSARMPACLLVVISDYNESTLYEFALAVFESRTYSETMLNKKSIKIVQALGELYFGIFSPVSDYQSIPVEDLDNIPRLYRNHFISESDWGYADGDYSDNSDDSDDSDDRDDLSEQMLRGSVRVYAWIYSCLRKFWKRQRLAPQSSVYI